MLTRDELSALLQGVNVEDIAREANVSTKTIYRMRHKANAPNYATIERILAAVARLKKPSKQRRDAVAPEPAHAEGKAAA